MYQKDNRKKIIFLGSPQIAASSLKTLSQRASSVLKIILVVTQPPSRSSRSRQNILSPVHQEALNLGIPVLSPEKATDPQFLEDIAILEPDLCITAAYGNYLPSKFLSLPKYGTINIHPSLLPRYRGAAPVQRAIENGDLETGVSLLYTVKEMDAGPIIAQEKYPLNNEIKAPELLEILFKLGTEILIKNLNPLFQNKIIKQDQSSSHITHANKILIDESILNFNLSAQNLHNKVRAFSGWPGTKLKFEAEGVTIECKIISTEISSNDKNLKPFEVSLEKDSIDICCGDNNLLIIKELQPSGKRALSAKDFQNGLKTKKLKLIY